MIKAEVRIELKAGVLDPQGQAVTQALNGLDFPEVTGARQGKVITLDLDETDPVRAEERVKAMCEKLLSNPVIERYVVSVCND